MTKIMSLRVQPELSAFMRAAAAEADISVSRLIRECVVARFGIEIYRETDRRRRSETRVT